MTWFLIVFFLTAEGGIEIRDGWYPLPMPNYEVCVQRALNTIAYLNLSGGGEGVVYCDIIDVEGEAV